MQFFDASDQAIQKYVTWLEHIWYMRGGHSLTRINVFSSTESHQAIHVQAIRTQATIKIKNINDYVFWVQ